VVSLVTVVVKKQEVISELGRYRGYSKPIYKEWLRTSQYITVRDGTLLAADIFRPVQTGQPVSDPLPVIWTHDRYHRADVRDGRLITQLDEAPWLQTVIKYGYVIGVVDVRGGGASYGTREGPFAQDETWDAYDITEWFAAQPWSNGRIGMFGRSYLGITQYMAASAMPPHLKVIFPEMAMFDLYAFVYPGGVFHHDFTENWNRLVRQLDTDGGAAPVDEDPKGVMRTEAVEAHKANRDVFKMFARLHYRDSRDDRTNGIPHLARSPSTYLNEVKKSGVSVYHLAGWYDYWARDSLVWFNNLDNPQKIVIGPWAHSQSAGLNLAAEHLRWYDYWLKEIDNGIMDEAPIHYYTMGAKKGKAWRKAKQWPLPNTKPTRYYFRSGPSGNVISVNDGLLRTQPPTSATGQDDYTVNYTTTSGKTTRWTDGVAGAFGYPDLNRNDEKGLTYTTLPLASDVEVTGHPVIYLWVTSTAKDSDFFAYLEEIDQRGFSHYITEGTLRASHRAISEPSFDYLGLPYHRSFALDVAALPSEPVELIFDLHPTSNIFDKGHRIRVTITGADKDNALTPERSSPPTVSIFRNANYTSYITLPIIPTASEGSALPTVEGVALPIVAITLAIIAIAAVFYRRKFP
jgi:uncharacterized protein